MRATPTLALLLAAAAAEHAAAQTAPAPLPAPRVGLLAGLSSATFGDVDADADAERRNGFQGGVYATLPFSRALAFRPELLYVQKGASGADDDARASLKLDYVEVPLLLQVTVPTAGGVRPQLYAGPALAVRARCEVSVSGGGVSASADCAELSDLTGGDDVEFRRFDVGGMVGGALAFDVGRRAVTIGARYTHGFARLIDGEDAGRNRAIGVYGSVEFPVGRGPR